MTAIQPGIKPLKTSWISIATTPPEPTLPTSAIRRVLQAVEPNTPMELYGFVRAVLGFDIPRIALQRGMNPPFEYLCHSFFEESHALRDCVIWANRGGGKTQLGAIATLLDLLFKPGIQIRILGGSLDQSTKMFGYLRQILERDEFADQVDGRITGKCIRLTNGAHVEILAQSERSVRGTRIQKLRCDEVDVFQPDVWRAVQFVTRSAQCGPVFVKGAIEVFSTMHKPFGLMQELVHEADAGTRRLFRWGLLDVLERCPSARSCNTCTLQPECQGSAKRGRGFLRIDDAIQQKARSSPDAWSSEMLCLQPSRSDCVYSTFDVATHVVARECDDQTLQQCDIIGGMDFGIRSPTVMLWAIVNRNGSSDKDGVALPALYIIDEHVECDLTIAQHLEIMKSRDWPWPQWVGIDPAGHQRNDHTGLSTATLLKQAGYRIRAQRTRIHTGIEAIRARLRSADGTVSLHIHPRCTQLIEAMSMYHYPHDKRESNEPVKDGADHACDALRYMIVALDRVGYGRARCLAY